MWVKLPVRFPDRLVILTVGRDRQREAAALMDAAAGLLDPSADVNARALQDYVEKARPELAGCVLHQVQMNYERREFELVVSHGSLPAAVPGWCVRRAKLHPEDEFQDPALGGPQEPIVR